MKMPLDQQATKDIELNVLREWFILTKQAHNQGPPRSGLVLLMQNTTLSSSSGAADIL